MTFFQVHKEVLSMAIKRGRPPKFVHDETGKPIVGFSFDKSNNSYYATYSKPRQYFGTDLARAMFEFYRYLDKEQADKPVIEIDLPYGPIKKAWGFVDLNEPIDPPVVKAAYAGEAVIIPEHLFLKRARDFILKDPIEAARKLGIPEIAIMRNLPKLEPPLPLKGICEYYIENRVPSKDEAKKCRAVWEELIDKIKKSG
jgi:hypothetical protein